MNADLTKNTTDGILKMLISEAVDFCNGDSSAETANTKCNLAQKMVAV